MIKLKTIFLLLKLELIILLNKSHAQNAEVILLPVWNLTDLYNISLPLKAFGQLILLNLRKTNHIVPVSDVWKYNTIGVTEKWSQEILKPCFYVHEDHISFTVINFCQGHGLEGLIFLDNDLLEIKPFWDNFASLSLINNFCIREQLNLSFGKSHRIKKSRQSLDNLNSYYLNDFNSKRRYIRSTPRKLVIELAVFVDEAAYHTFMSFLDNNEEHLRNMILAYVNNIQATFHNPSFGVPLDISLVRLDFMKKQPKDLLVFNDASKLLDSFCQYAATHNHPNSNNSHHWDIGLYLTAIDIYVITNNTKFDLLGLAYDDEVCSTHSCAIVELGVDSLTSSFASSIIATHEIGHVLGIDHDSDSINETGDSEINCPNYKHIMSSIKLYRGQITWSKFSRDVTKTLRRTKTCLLDRTKENHENELDHTRYHNLPGRKWTAKAQCELHSRDKDANIVTMHDICQTLHCETKRLRGKYFFAGPALEGTQCALGKECRRGECVPVIEPPYIFKYCKKDKWSEWKEDDCQSPCLKKSKGVIIKRRFCKHGSHRTTSCGKPYYAIDLCDDSKVCDNRKTIEEFTNTKCTEFSETLESIDKVYLFKLEKKPGSQVSHNDTTPWTACTIFCKQKNIPHNSSQFYSPYMELLSLHVDPYFPEGTWCHYQDGQNYYCRHHYCLPENYSVE